MKRYCIVITVVIAIYVPTLLSSCHQVTPEPTPSTRSDMTRASDGLPGGALRADDEGAYETVFAVESADALRAALQDLHGETEIRLVAGEFAFDGPIQLGGKTPRRLRLVGQGPAWTRLIHRGRQPFIQIEQNIEGAVEVEVANMSIEAPTAATIVGRGEGMLIVRNIAFQGQVLAHAPNWLARWFPRDDEPGDSPAMNVATVQRADASAAGDTR